MTTQNLRDAAKAVLREKFIAIQSYLKKQEKSKINNLTLHLKELQKEEQRKPKVRRKEIIKIRCEINEKEMKETTAKMNKIKRWFFEKINKIDKPLARLIQKKTEKTQINRIRNEKEVTADTAEIQTHGGNTIHYLITKRSLKISKRKSKNTSKQMTMKTRRPKTYGMQQKHF